LNVLFVYKRQKSLNNESSSIGITNLSTRYLDRWRKVGDISNIQKLTTAFDAYLADSYVQQSDKYLINSSFMRLKNASLAYNLPDGLVKRIHMQKCRVYVQGENLFNITGYPGLDPETGNNVMAPLRITTFGLQITL
jgi:hypothetical protein